MLSKTTSRIAAAAASALIASAALAVPAQAGTSVGPHQYFIGQVFGVSTTSTPNVIGVACAGPSATGHPDAGQTVEVSMPVTTPTFLGYTGNSAVEIDADLSFPQGSVVVVTRIATFTSYDLKLPIPTSITVPCSGSGVMSFTPYPDDSGRSFNVKVTFQSPGV